MIIDAAEQRWTAWKHEGARQDAARTIRMRVVFAVLSLAPVVWFASRL